MKIVVRRSSQVLATVLLFLALSSVFFGVEPVWAADGSEALSMSTVEDVSILGSGDALVTLLVNVADSPLADMYRELLAAPSDAGVGEEMPIPENKTEDGAVMPVRQEFHRSIKKEQRSSFGFETWIFNSSMVPRGEQDEVRVSISAYASLQVVNFTAVGSDGIWEIVVGPTDENATMIAAGALVTRIAFAQFLLESLEGDQVYEASRSVRIRVPVDATLLNGDELSGSSWTVSFGGGTSISASVSMDDPSTVVLNERTVVTEQNITASPAEIFEAFRGYGVFKIRYLLPESAWVEGEITSPSDSDWSFSWAKSWSPVSLTWGPTYSYGSVTISAQLKITPTFTFSGYIGWDFDWWGDLNWFEVWIGASASLTIEFGVTASAAISKSWETTLMDVTLARYVTAVDYVPVWWDLDLILKPTLSVGAGGTLSFTGFRLVVGASFKFGVRWDEDDGWSTIKEADKSATFEGPSVSLTGSAWIEPSLKFRLALLCYGVAGPYVEFEPYIRGTLTYYAFDLLTTEDDVIAWEIKSGFRVNVYFTIKGWLGKLLGLGDSPKTLLDYEIKSWRGHWGKAPTSISIDVQPSEVNVDAITRISGMIASPPPFEGSKAGTVHIRYTVDGVIWTEVGSTRSKAEGDYTFLWLAPSIGTFTVGSYWTGNEGFLGAVSANVTLSVLIFVGGDQTFSYDDDSAESSEYLGEGDRAPSEGFAVRFTPPNSLWSLEGIEVKGGGVWVNTYDVYFDVVIWSVGLNGILGDELFRGTYLIRDYFSQLTLGWSLSDLTWSPKIPVYGVIVTEDIYIAVFQHESYPFMGLIIGKDESTPIDERSYLVSRDPTPSILEGPSATYDVMYHVVGYSFVEDQTTSKDVADWPQPVERTDTFYTTSDLRRVTLRISSIWDWDEADYVESSLKSLENLDGVLSVFFSYSPPAHRAFASIVYDPAKITAEEINSYANSIPTSPYRGYNYSSSIIEDKMEPVYIYSWVKFDWRRAVSTWMWMRWEWYDPDGNLLHGKWYFTDLGLSPVGIECRYLYIENNKLWSPGLNDPIMDIQEEHLDRFFQVKIYYGDYLAVTQTFRIIKRESSISIALSSDSITYEDSVQISSQISPPLSEGTTTLQYSTDELNWNNIEAGTPSDGYYSSIWTPPHAGTYYIRAQWSGTLTNTANTSETKTLTVNPAPTSLTTTLSANTITYGSSVAITASMTPALQGRTVTFQNGTDDSTWYYLSLGTTDPNGQITTSWTPPDVGVYYIRSTWFGDTDYIGATSTSQQLTVEPSHTTMVEIVTGADTEIDRTLSATVEFGVKVKDLETGQYLTNTGRVVFYVSDQPRYNIIVAGLDNDSDGDGIYSILWDIGDWSLLGPQHWSAEFTGTPQHMPSLESSTLTIHHQGVELWLDPTFQEVSISSTETFTINFKWNRDTEDTFDLSLTGLDPSWYTLSQTSITVSSIGQTEEITLTISPPYAPTILKDYEFTVTATSRADPSFSVSATATARVDFTPTLPPSPTGGLATAVQPKTIYMSAGTTIVINILIINNQDFDDTIKVDLTTSGIPEEYQANLTWFDWTTAKVFLPAGGSIYIPLEITVPADTPTNMYVFRAVATSTANLAIAARDAGIIRVQ